MLGADAIRHIAERILSDSSADQTEVVVLARDDQLTRFANNEIHQHVAETDTEIRIRAVVDQRIGVAVTNDPSAAALQRTLHAAVAIAQRQPPDPDFVSLPVSQPIPQAAGWSAATAACTPLRRAQTVELIIGQAAAHGLDAAGAFATTVHTIAVANSLGVWAYHAGTAAEISTVVAGEASGWAGRASHDVDEIDAAAVGREAVAKALRSRDPQPLEPDVYPVVLEPYAVVELLDFPGWGALDLQEGRSPFVLGQQQASELVTLYDDGLDPAGLPLPCDFEGVPKQRVEFIERGISRNVVYDTRTAAKQPGKRSTGHARLAPNSSGPVPFNLFMEPGTTPMAALTQPIRRGVYVTRFHYVNTIHEKQALLTGMTRDGTFLIEDGEVTRPIHNLRFTQRALEALKHVEAVSQETVLHRQAYGGIRVPALRIGAFNFTSSTEF